MKADLSDVVEFLKSHHIWFVFSGNYAVLKLSIEIFFFFGINITFWILAVVSAYHEGFTGNFDGKIYFICIILLSLVQDVAYLLKRHDSVRIVNYFKLLTQTQNQHWEIRILEEDAKKMWKAIKAYNMMIGLFALVYFVSPLIIDTCLALFFPSSKIFKVPLSYDGFLDVTHLERNYKYYLVVICSGIWAMCNMVPHTGCVGMLCIYVIYLGSQIKILIKKIEKFSSSISSGYVLYKSNITSEEHELLKDIIDHHIAVIRLSEEIKNLIGFPYASQNALASVCLCITMITSVILLEKNEYFLVGSNVACVVIVTILVYGSCYLGEYLQSQFTELYYTFCNVPWYILNPELRNVILFMTLHASKTRYIDFHRLSTLNLHSFMLITNTSYSYFMVLKSVL